MTDATITNDEPAVDEQPGPVALARKRLDDLRADRLIADVQSKIAEELGDVEREIADELALQMAIKAHGKIMRDIQAVYTPLGVVIVRRPRRALYREYQVAEDKLAGQDVLIHGCLVHPDAGTYNTITDEYPAVPEVLAGGIALLAGHGFNVAAAKS